MNSIKLQMKKSGDFAFENATRLLSAIEIAVQSEINQSELIDRAKVERKKGSPFLILPIANKSRSLDAVFPTMKEEENKKKGSSGIMSPLLLSPSSLKKSQGTPKALGRVMWDTKDNKWVESKRSPALIRRFDSSPSLTFKKKVGDMTYDPITRSWIGNEDVLADFGDDDVDFDVSIRATLGSAGSLRADVADFVVGNEFNITPEMKKQFEKSAKNHCSSTFGWWTSDVRMDLFAIRSMAITRIVYDVKNRKDAYADDKESCTEASHPSSSSSSTAPNSRNTSRSSSPSSSLSSNESSNHCSSGVTSPSSGSEDCWENDVGPWKGTIKLRLPKQAGVLNLDFFDDELSEEQEMKPNNVVATEKHIMFNEEEKEEEEEDWGADFVDFSVNKIINKASSFLVNSAKSTSLPTSSLRLPTLLI